MFHVFTHQARFLVKTNFLVSLGAVFLTLQTQVQLGMRPYIYPYIVIIFSASYMAYNTHTVVGWFDAHSQRKSNYQWVENQNEGLQRMLLMISIVLFFCGIVLAKQKVVAALVPLSMVTLCYSFPLLKTKTIFFRLREVPFLKVFLISVTWSAVTVLLPAIHSSIEISHAQLVMMLSERFLLIFAVAIPFDIRDMKTDTKAKLKTVPLAIGKGNALVLSNVCLLVFIAISIYHFSLNGPSFVLMPLMISVIVLIVLINAKFRNMSAVYYALLDGTLILQGALVCLSYYLNDGIAGVLPI